MKNGLVILVVFASAILGITPSWAATPMPKPSITALAPGGDQGSSDGKFPRGSGGAAMQKYQACLAKAGIKMPAFGRPGGGAGGAGGRGIRPTGAPTAGSSTNPPTFPGPRPTLSMTPKQQKAFVACGALRPKFGGFRGGPDNGFTNPQGNPPSSTGASTAGKSASYIMCLNTHGLPVQTMSDVQGLDAKNTKVIAAKKACVGK